MSLSNVPKFTGVGLMAAMVMVLGVGSVLAGAIPVQNGSFESPVLALNTTVKGWPPDSWNVDNVANLTIGNQGGIWSYYYPIPDGNQIVHLGWNAIPVFLWQNTGAAMITGKVYTFSLIHRAIYQPSQTSGAQTLYMYLYGATDTASKGDQLATAVYQHPGYPAAWQTYTLSFVCDAANNGKYVSIGFDGGTGNHCLADLAQVTTTVTVTGTVSPKDYSGDIKDVAVRVELSQGATTLATTRQFLDAAGRFSISADVPAGTYNVTVKSTGWLNTVLPVTIAASPCDAGTFNLINGDLNCDNSLTTGDLSIFLSNMDMNGD